MIRQTFTPFHFTDAERQERQRYESRNGCIFTFKLGLGEPILIQLPSNSPDPLKCLANAVMEFTDWHHRDILPRLNGFRGYDIAQFSIFEK